MEELHAIFYVEYLGLGAEWNGEETLNILQ